MAIEPEEMLKTVLLVEDSVGDTRLAIEAFKETNKSVKLRLVRDGLAAMAYLRREGKYADAPRPELILLDLNLPKMGGWEVLAQIKADDSLKTIPTIILTTSAPPEDAQECHKLQADSYLRKPVGFENYDELVRSINTYWLESATLPQRGALNASAPSGASQIEKIDRHRSHERGRQLRQPR
jgi:chemotaxis family two-component system response regulator Rcp1